MQDNKALLIKVNAVLNNYEKIAKITGENFNIFSVMRMEANEVKTHSAIISELLNPKGKHGLEDVPLKLFIEQIKSGINDIENRDEILKKFYLDTKNSKSIVEEHIGRINKDKTEGGRIDIVIKDNKGKAIVIENKINAPEQQNQLLRYKNAYSKAPILYLTLEGKKPDSAKYFNLNKDLPLEEDLVPNKDYFLVSYEKDILEWLEKCLKESVKFPMLREVIQQYIYLIKKLTNQTTNIIMAKEVQDIIKENYLASKEISNNFKIAKQQILAKFWNDLAENLKFKLKKDCEHNWKVEINSFKHNSNNFVSLNVTTDLTADKCNFYYRYNLNNFETYKGIMIDQTILKNELTSISKINSQLENPFKFPGEISIDYSSTIALDCTDDEQVAEIASKDLNEDKITECSDEFLNYINSNTENFTNIPNTIKELGNKI